MEIILCLFIVAVLLGTFPLHIKFWEERNLSFYESVACTLFTFPVFPIFGIIQLILMIKEDEHEMDN